MKNDNALTFFHNMAKNNPNPHSAKLVKANDFSDFDAEFILKHSNPNAEILDLATGTGITLNKYYKKVKHITAVEKFKEFSDFIEKSDKITVINEDVTAFCTQKKYDLILMFGLVSYFSETEIKKLYEKYKKLLKPHGKLIIKNQFGLKEDVSVEGFSEELKTDYYAQYRHIEKETKILKELGYKNITVTDIYPPECNRWENTHFYAITAEV